jgi:UDP-N-acetylmuramoyl-L-alanyl-D-glutamate--2,6-diaminopimelate ligase
MNAPALDHLNIRRLVTDSRRVTRGDTFVAYPGETQDGRRYIAQAVARGAASVLWEKRGFHWQPEWRVPNAGIPQLRARAGLIASRVYGGPSARLWMIGVTGTNGKTTCSQWIAQALTQCGRRTAVIGTLGYGLARTLHPLANTTPDAVWLHGELANFLRRGARAVSMEVSSIGLDQDRVAGVEFDVALFTNLTRDHLDYHRTMQRYRRAKLRLFECVSLKHAIVNLDDDFGAELAQRVRRRGLAVIGYGFGARPRDARRLPRLSGANLEAGAAGMQFDVRSPWGRATIESPLIGRHNASNLLGTLCDAVGERHPVQRRGGGARQAEAGTGPHAKARRRTLSAGGHRLCAFARRARAGVEKSARSRGRHRRADHLCVRLRRRSRSRQAAADGRRRVAAGRQRRHHQR